ncbi:chromo domain-containingprotein [Purpureocillium lavendulum]|uniref:Chromo domain-containingprotein n=1 Tax=Purpureocillium lavendulum TaxID=1247861 RepID=A0AB34G2H7_9HYPO|nr:chromo domain-containingprotein [Purpureocillium lavendulum]
MELGPPPIRTDTKLRERKPKLRSRIVIPLSSKPRDYVPNSGPPLQSICLLPPADSTAYIVERIILPSPGPAANGKPLPKRMTYIVGWRDLPAARLLVPAMNILDYVSPRALEEWEWNMEMELEEDRKVLAEEKKKELEQPLEERKAASKKRGRPPAHTAIEAGALAEPEPDAHTRHKTGAMSLSTPKKNMLEDFEGLSDEEEMSPSRQLARETGWETGEDLEGGFEDTMEMDYERGESSGWERPVGVLSDTDRSRGTSTQSAPGWSSRQLAMDSASQSPYQTPPASRLAGPPDQQPATPAHGGFVSFNASNGISSVPSTVRTDPIKEGDITLTAPRARPRPKSTKKPNLSSRKKAASTPAQESEPVASEGGEAWVVQCIQGMELYEVEGRGLVRYFKVLWEGDWPPDQNPTWEPEENLPPSLVRNYRKQDKKRRRLNELIKPGSEKKPAPSRAQPKPRPLPKPKLTQYRSVSDAFLGGEGTEDLGPLGSFEDSTPSGEPSQGEVDDDAEELLVVDEGAQELKTPSWKESGSSFGAFLF